MQLQCPCCAAPIYWAGVVTVLYFRNVVVKSRQIESPIGICRYLQKNCSAAGLFSTPGPGEGVDFYGIIFKI
jgi:hypothetical protein